MSTKLPLRFGYDRLIEWVTARRAPLVIALLAFAMTLPAMSIGMVADDYTLAGQVKQDVVGAYAFEHRDPQLRRASILAMRDSGYAPWWIDEDFHLAFMRPLASLSLALDFRLWPDATWLMIVENALIFGGLVLLVAGLYRALDVSPAVAGLATFLYAFKPDQSLSTGWISGRNTLMAAAFGMLALLAYLRAQRTDQTPRARLGFTLGAMAAFMCALLSGEIGVSAGALMFAHACTLQEGPLLKRLLRLWPYALVAVGWYATHRLLGYGSVGSGFYIEPGRDPLFFLWGVLTGIPIYLATQLTYPVASLAGMSEHVFALLLGLSLLALLLLRNLLVPLLRASRTARFFALGSVLAVVPLGASLPLDRLVYFIGFGTSGLLAMVIVQRLGRDNVSQPQFGAGMLYHLHGFWLPLVYIPAMFGTTTAVLGGGTIALEQALPRDGKHGVVLANGPSHLSVTLQRDMRAHWGTTQVPFVDMLYAGSAPLRVRRPSQRVLELDVAEGYLANAFERVVRDPRRKPFRPGDTVELSRMRVIVLAVNVHGAPTRVRFELAYDPDHGDEVWLAWQKQGPTPWRLPAVGQEVELPGIAAL